VAKNDGIAKALTEFLEGNRLVVFASADKHEQEALFHATDLVFALNEYFTWLRSEIKYNENCPAGLDVARSKLHEILLDAGIPESLIY
jgi:hypothetical protein